MPPLLDIRDFTLSLRTQMGPRLVLDHADLQVGRGEIHGLVGESGCGKSTLVRAILGLRPPGSKIEAGQIMLGGLDLTTLDEPMLARDVRSRRIGFIPQDPFQSFNPLFRVGTQLMETMRWHAGPDTRSAARRRQHLLHLLERLRIPDPPGVLARYPHELSGGQLQRLMIAGALACGPELILADEPTSALDVTTQQQILLLLEELARETGTSVLLVTHDLGLVAQFCDRLTVMYAGQTVESLPRAAALRGLRHPYARLLLECHPDREGALRGIPGVVPALGQMPSGCRFHLRCPSALPVCESLLPAAQVLAGRHVARCWVLRPEPAVENVHGG